jgi:hypothetical protein
MTKRRREVLAAIVESDRPVTMAELARKCRLYDYRAARRIINDLKEMKAL